MKVPYLRVRIDTQIKQSYKRPVDIILDVLIESWENLLIRDADKSAIIYSIWKNNKNVYFKRLSLYAFKRLMEKDYVG